MRKETSTCSREKGVLYMSTATKKAKAPVIVPKKGLQIPLESGEGKPAIIKFPDKTKAWMRDDFKIYYIEETYGCNVLSLMPKDTLYEKMGVTKEGQRDTLMHGLPDERFRIPDRVLKDFAAQMLNYPHETLCAIGINDDGKWIGVVPDQECTTCMVDVDSWDNCIEVILKNGYDRVGTIHTHPGGPGCSGIDKNELWNDFGGVHYIVGNNGEVATYYVINGETWRIMAEQWLRPNLFGKSKSKKDFIKKHKVKLKLVGEDGKKNWKKFIRIPKPKEKTTTHYGGRSRWDKGYSAHDLVKIQHKNKPAGTGYRRSLGGFWYKESDIVSSSNDKAGIKLYRRLFQQEKKGTRVSYWYSLAYPTYFSGGYYAGTRSCPAVNQIVLTGNVADTGAVTVTDDGTDGTFGFYSHSSTQPPAEESSKYDKTELFEFSQVFKMAPALETLEELEEELLNAKVCDELPDYLGDAFSSVDSAGSEIEQAVCFILSAIARIKVYKFNVPRDTREKMYTALKRLTQVLAILSGDKPTTIMQDNIGLIPGLIKEEEQNLNDDIAELSDKQEERIEQERRNEGKK
jgi:hypothetical protein